MESQSSLATPLVTPCETCPEATLSVLLTQEKSYSDAQAAATAAIMRANAQANPARSWFDPKRRADSRCHPANPNGGTGYSCAQATLVQQSIDQIAASTQTAVANNFATHTTTPFSDYFDPRLLHDLAEELRVQVIPSANDGLRYAFILEKGEIDAQPPVNTRPTDQDGNQIERRIAPQPEVLRSIGKHTVEHQKLDKFLKIAEAIEAAKNTAQQPPPEVLLMNELEFNQLMAEYENERNQINLKKSAPSG
jgi:hypothetical protein